MTLYFLTYEDIVEIHADQIKCYGGGHGIRDENLLVSAIAQPMTMFNGKHLHFSIYEKAAAYLYHICQNHPFIDGNKRTATAAALNFLNLNGYNIDYDKKELESIVWKVVRDGYKKNEIAIFLSKTKI